MARFHEIRDNLLARKIRDLYPNTDKGWLELALYKEIHLGDVTLKNGDVQKYIIATNTYTGDRTFFNIENGGKEYPLL